jgi:hypothetical protein
MNITANKMATIIEMFRSSQLKSHIPSMFDASIDDEELAALIRTLYEDEVRRPSNLSPRKLAKEVRTLTARLGASDLQIFTLEEISAVRTRATALGSGDYRGPEGWSCSPCDPMKVLGAFPSLHVRPGWVLRAYQHVHGDDAVGLVFAMPEDERLPEPSTCMVDEELDPRPQPAPKAGLGPMEVIDGDGSAWSYLCASLLFRELVDFCAVWDDQIWFAEQIIDRPPGYPENEITDPIEARTLLESAGWTTEGLPGEWRPNVQQGYGEIGTGMKGRNDIERLADVLRELERGETRISASFMTYRGVNREELWRDEDLYEPGMYDPLISGYTAAKRAKP